MLPNWHRWVSLWRYMRGSSTFWIGGFSLVVLLISAACFKSLEHKTWEESLWWAFVTTTTVGYGDFFPETTVGRVIGVLLMFLGIGLFGGVTAGLATELLEYRSKLDRGVKKLKTTNHILITGWNETGEDMVRDILADQEEQAIVILAELPKNPLQQKNVSFVHGEVTEQTLELANAAEADTALVLGDQGIADLHGRDAKTVINSLTIKNYNSKIYTCIQLFDPRSRTHAGVSRADEVVVIGSLVSGLLSRSALDHGSSKAILSLLRADEGEEIYRIPVPSHWLGKSFADALSEAKLKENMLLIGVESVDKELELNPGAEYTLENGDMVAVIAEDRPVF